VVQPVFSAGVNNKEIAVSEKDPGDKSPAKKVRNKTLVRVYPDMLKRIMHVVAKENEGKAIDFYVFDTKGTLVLNYKMQPGNHEKIAGLARGSYVYRVFCCDEETKSGNFIIK
jgi:hypothetical protein